MKIAIVSFSHFVNDVRIYYREALSLKKRYNDITIVAVSKKEIDDKFYIDKNGFKIYLLKRLRGRIGIIKTIKKIYKILVKINADIYHYHDWELSILTPFLKFKNKKVVYDVHENFPERIINYLGKKPDILINSLWIRFLEKLSAKRSDYIITVIDKLTDRFKRYNKNVITIPNYPLKVKIENRINKINKEIGIIEALKENFYDNIKNKKYDLIYHGLISDLRGFYTMLKLIKYFKEYYNKELKLIVIGTYSKIDPVEIEKYLKDNNIKDLYTHVPQVPFEKIRDYLQQAKIGLVLLKNIYQYRYSIPNKMLEYMQYGLPVIVSNFGYMKKIVEESNSGFTVDPEDIAEIAEKVKKLIDDENLYKKFSLNGIKSVNEKYNWEICEKKLFEVYSVLEEKL